MGIGVSGLMSGLDTESIISKLMEIEQRPITLLQSREAGYQAKISAVGTLKSALSKFNGTVSALSETDSFTAWKVASSNTDILPATTGSPEAAGSYHVTVSALAKAEQERSSAFASSDATVGTGTISIQVGTGTAVDVAIDAAHSSLSGIASAINGADAGVTASVVDDGTGNFYLTILSEKTGAANAVQITISDNDGNNDDASGLSALYSDPPTHAFTVTQAAQDALLNVNGVDVVRSENTISDLIEGVTLTLNKADPASPAEVTVSKDTDAVVKKVQAFVDGYNALMDTIEKLGGYDAATKTAGTLTGDSLTRGIPARISRLMQGQVTGVAEDVNGLSRIGISFNRDGRLTFDSSTFTDALTSNEANVARLFSNDDDGNEGLAVRLGAFIDSYVDGSGSVLDSRVKGLNSSVEKIQDQVTAMEDRLVKREENLRRQFEALELLLSSYQSTSGQLSQQLASITNLNAQIANK